MPLQILCKWGLVHTTPEKFENASLFLRLGLKSTLIRHENGTFRKPSSNRRNLITPTCRFHVDGKHFENGAFWQRCEVFHKRKSKMTGNCYILKFLRRSVDGNSEWNPFSNSSSVAWTGPKLKCVLNSRTTMLLAKKILVLIYQRGQYVQDLGEIVHDLYSF